MKIYKASTFISSWHISEHENAAMWDKYTHDKNGVAIKTNAMKLIHSIDNSKYDHSTRKIKEVIYTDKNPSDFRINEDLLEEYYYLFFFYKMKDFEYEKEVRILISLFQNPHSFSHFNSEQINSLENQIDKIFENNPIALPLIDLIKNANKNKNTYNLYINSPTDLIDEIVLSPYSHDIFSNIVNKLLDYLKIENKIKISQSNRKQWI